MCWFHPQATSEVIPNLETRTYLTACILNKIKKPIEFKMICLCSSVFNCILKASSGMFWSFSCHLSRLKKKVTEERVHIPWGRNRIQESSSLLRASKRSIKEAWWVWCLTSKPFRKSKIVYKAKGRIARQVTWLSARACSSASLPNASAPPHWLLYRRWISVVLLKALWLVEVWGHNNLQVPQMDWGSPLVTPNEGASCPLFFDLSVHGIK